MYIPRKRPKPQKRAYVIRAVPAFKAFIRKLHCAVEGCPNTNIDPAHVRCDLPADALKGGTGLKPHDAWIIPLCHDHHLEQHRGEVTFAQLHNLDPAGLAQILWEKFLKTGPGRNWLAKFPEYAPSRAATQAIQVGTSEEAEPGAEAQEKGRP